MSIISDAMGFLFGPAARRPAVDSRLKIHIGGVPIPQRMEGRHFSLSGATGAGKTVAIRALLRTIRARADNAVVVDAGGELMSEFGRPDDLILSPLDGRSVRWDPVRELASPADSQRVALALIPDIGPDGGSGAEWSAYARTLVAACLAVARDLDELADLLFSVPSYSDVKAGTTGLDEILADTPAAQFFAPGAARMTASIRAIVGSRLQWLPFASAVTGAPWTARRWAASLDGAERKKQGRIVWIPVRADHAQMLAPYVAAVLQQMIVQTLSLAPSPARNIWFFVDEFGSYPRIADLPQILTQGRKFGGRVVLGYQSVAQLESRYGRPGSQSILSCIGTHLVLRQGDPQSAEWASQLLGKREVIRHTASSSIHGTTDSEQIRDEPVVHPADLARLPDLVGYLRVPGDYPVARVRLPIPPRSGGEMPANIPAPWLAKVRSAPAKDGAPITGTDAPSGPTSFFGDGAEK
ncbi:MAG TPA: type IV secretion system DNA-binding domain-containing protein [Nevskiaceae bacterium]|nr:type IV secretion system DNA-binding domain-containing protein [Nevskiaceae bacterium]